MIYLVLILLLVGAGAIAFLKITLDKFKAARKENGSLNSKYSKLQGQHEALNTQAFHTHEEMVKFKDLAHQWNRRAEELKRYTPILEIDHAVEVRKQEKIQVEAEILEAQKSAAATIDQGNQDAAALRQKAQQDSLDIIQHAKNQASRIEHDAHIEAEKIAGEAYEVMTNRAKVKREIKAIENKIIGYGDEYLVPIQSILDDLADQWDHKEAGAQLKAARKKSKDMVKFQSAALCDYAEARRQQTAIQFVVDAFNGRVDAILAKARHDNYGKLKQEILDVFAIVQRNGEAFRNARITTNYLEARLDELKWAVSVYELKKIEQEEQRAIREQMREEAKVRKDIEKAEKEAAKEQATLEKALQKAQHQAQSQSADQRAKFEAEIARLQAQLTEAQEKGKRAQSMAEQTRQGHVYIISNIGSFGENVFKIGLTRRLEPLDRVKELGDASVPFPFDVHAMIHSEDAPALENQLHKIFVDHQVNKVNSRKEFFNVSLTDIREAVEKFGTQTHWTMKAEALQYRESKTIADKELQNPSANSKPIGEYSNN